MKVGFLFPVFLFCEFQFMALNSLDSSIYLFFSMSLSYCNGMCCSDMPIWVSFPFSSWFLSYYISLGWMEMLSAVEIHYELCNSPLLFRVDN